MILRKDLTTAISEANRFLQKAKDLHKADIATSKNPFDESDYALPGPLSASLKRASMDLTKTLAKLRKTN